MLQLLMDMAKGIAELGAAIGAGLSVLGAGFGIGKIVIALQLAGPHLVKRGQSQHGFDHGIVQLCCQ